MYADLSSTDTHSRKASMQQQWDAAAAGWNAHSRQIQAWLRRPSEAMLNMAEVRSGASVLDVAAGAGEHTLEIAQRVGPEGYVLATDLSAQILALAQQKFQAAGCDWAHTWVADAGQQLLPPASFDAAVCRLGWMLLPDPLRGLKSMKRALRPGARLCTLVFSGPQRNPCITTLMATALRHAGLPAADPFQPGGLLSLGKPGLADDLFRAAGFHDVASTAVDAPFHLPAVRDYMAFVRDAAGPVRQILGRLAPEAAEAAWSAMEEELDRFTGAQGWVGPNELLLTVGQA